MSSSKRKDGPFTEINQAKSSKFYQMAQAGELTLWEIAVGVIIFSHMSYDTGTCYPSVKGIADRLKISHKTGRRAVDGLVRKGIFVVCDKKIDGRSVFSTDDSAAMRQMPPEQPKPVEAPARISFADIVKSTARDDDCERPF